MVFVSGGARSISVLVVFQCFVNKLKIHYVNFCAFSILKAGKAG